jgi:hypothetical protein
LQHLLRATFNNIEELGIDFVRYCLNLWLRIWEQCVWQKLFTEREQEELFAEHNVDALLRGNAAARAAFYQVMTNAAIMNRNECRKLENLDPVDGGDVFLVQGATVPLDDDGKPESEFVKGPEPAQPPADDSEVDDMNRDDPDAADKLAAVVSARVERVLTQDLSRMMTKEAKAVSAYAKRPDTFVSAVDQFYAEHSAMLVDVVTATVEALAACGVNVSRDAVVSAWVSEGKSLIIDAAGRATPKELPDAIQRVLESKTWIERPERAMERAKDATLVV